MRSDPTERRPVKRDDVVIECGGVGYLIVYAYDNGMRVLEELPQTAGQDEIHAAQMRVASAVMQRQNERGPRFCPHGYQFGDGVYLPFGVASDRCRR